MIDFTNIEKYKENNRIEAKKALGGIILLGVEEYKDKSLHPIDLHDPEKLIKDFRDRVNNVNKVSANILTDKDVTVEEIDGKRIVAIRIPRAGRSDKPIYIDGNPLSGSYRRNGEGDYKCTKEEVRAMMRDAAIKNGDKKRRQKIDSKDRCPQASYHSLSYRKGFRKELGNCRIAWSEDHQSKRDP